MVAEHRRKALLVGLALLTLAGLAGAQGRKGKGKSRGKPPAPEWNGAEKAGANAGGAKAGPIYLPGFDQPGAAKVPVGPKGKPAQAPQPVAPPLDPLQAADQVTAAADHLARRDEAEEKLLREHFKVCDLDANDWLSLRECEVTLAMPREEFRRMDGDQDGRLSPAEFAFKKEYFLARMGAQPRVTATPPAEPAQAAPGPAPPAAPQTSTETRPLRAQARSELRALYPRPGDLLTRYDADASKGLDAHEVEKLFIETGLTLSAELVVAQMDPNDSGQLEAGELIGLAVLASRHMPAALRPPPQEEASAVAAAEDAAPAALHALQGMTHFGRLDPNRDGYIDESELRALQNPVRLDIRLRALLSAMDPDGDGRLSEAEFSASMRDVRR